MPPPKSFQRELDDLTDLTIDQWVEDKDRDAVQLELIEDDE